jgi:hypothetical protein
MNSATIKSSNFFMKDLPGFINIRNLVIVIIILVILGLMGVSVEEDIVENEQVQENTSYVWNGVEYVWETYLAGPASFLWNDIFVGILWETFAENMERLRAGQPADYFTPNTDVVPSIPGLIDEYNDNH